MKKILGANQFVLTAMAILLAIVGYLNFTGDKEGTRKDENNVTYNETITEEKEDVVQSVMAENKKAEPDTKNQEDKDSKDEKDNENAKDNEKDNDIDEAAGDENSDEDGDEKTEDVNVSKSDVGEVVMVNNFISTDAIYDAKLQREQSRAKNKADLLSIVDDDKTSQDMKDKALNEILLITANAEKELAAESLLAAKGYDNAIVSIAGQGADVIVDVDSISKDDATVIMDVVKRKTGVASSNIVISPVTSAGELN